MINDTTRINKACEELAKLLLDSNITLDAQQDRLVTYCGLEKRLEIIQELESTMPQKRTRKRKGKTT